MRFWIVDSETTGMEHGKDKAVEVGGILLEDGHILKRYESLVDPGIPIPPEACAIHHITDDMVEGAPDIDAALQPILAEDVDFIVAHNAKFDQGFLDLGDQRWLCTWKLSNKLFKDAPSFSNQVLRYYLGLELPVEYDSFHRALADTEVTTQLFLRILREAKTDDPYEKMLEITNSPVLLRKVNFGEHFGKKWSEVPTGYLKWIVGKPDSWEEDKLYTAKYWLERS